MYIEIYKFFRRSKQSLSRYQFTTVLNLNVLAVDVDIYVRIIFFLDMPRRNYKHSKLQSDHRNIVNVIPRWFIIINFTCLLVTELLIKNIELIHLNKMIGTCMFVKNKCRTGAGTAVCRYYKIYKIYSNI